MTYEDKFYEILKDMYIGTPIKGDSGYVNLMTMKAKHFEIIEEELTKVVKEKTKEFPEFKEELYERLYDFFKDYFTDTGSIYYTYNELNKNTYEKVYSENEDVSLFWKTQMLYYVKTDILYQDIEFEVDDIVYYFDVSKLDHKRNNEKREIIYRECKVEENKDKKKIIFYPEYSVRGRTTKTNDILKKINNKGINIIEEELLKIFRIFEKQSEVDYFINKNSKKFLRDRFDVYLYQYMFGDGERSYNKFNEKRINQLMVLKDVAYNVIDFISQFEDELVRIWNKPKFVLDSNYIITKDKIMEQNNGDKILNKLIASDGIDGQISEWKELGIVDDGFKLTNILDEKYKYLPFDTKYFKEYELDILKLFDDLDKSIDGRLIKSENYQALNTIKDKYKNTIKCIYIDPPYNRRGDEFVYKDNYGHSNWLSMMQDRLELARYLLKEDGIIFISISDEELYNLNLLIDKIFGEDLKLGTIIVQTNKGGQDYLEIAKTHEYLVCIGNSENTKLFELEKDIGNAKLKDTKGFYTERELRNRNPRFDKHNRPNLYYPIYINPDVKDEEGHCPISLKKDKKYNVEVYPLNSKGESSVWRWSKKKLIENIVIGDLDKSNVYARQKRDGGWNIYEKCRKDTQKVKSIWDESEVRTENGTISLGRLFGSSPFPHPKPVELIEKVLNISIEPGDIVLDFFSGTGTTVHAVQKFNKINNIQGKEKVKVLAIEMADYFEEIMLPRTKKTSYTLDWENGIPINNDGNSVFFKYYELEQYEDTLRKSVYKDDEHLIYNQNKSPFEQYVFLRDEKLNYCMGIQDDEVKVDLNKLYEKIDIPETLSNLTGKWIKKITEDEVIFEDGTKVDLNNIDYKMIKPLIWWCE